MTQHTFKNHPISEAEMKWLQEIAATPHFDTRIAKVKLWGVLPEDFDHKAIDRRILSDGLLTPLGRWYLNHHDPLLIATDKVASTIRQTILENPGIRELETKEIATKSGLARSLVSKSIGELGKLGQFYSGATSTNEHGYLRIELATDSVYDEYLRFKGLEDLLERYYTENNPNKPASDFTWNFPFTSNISAGTSNFHEPILNKPIKQNTAFVLMAMDPEKAELVDVYNAIKDVCHEFGINAYRADAIEHQDRITDLILREIATCEYLVADLSLERPNVYYEVGYAHAISKKPILYRKIGTPLHFDLAVHNVPEYKNVTELREMLRKRFEAILGRSAKDKGR